MALADALLAVWLADDQSRSLVECSTLRVCHPEHYAVSICIMQVRIDRKSNACQPGPAVARLWRHQGEEWAMRLRRAECTDGVQCPAVERRDDGWFVVVGDRVERVDLPAHEGAVAIPPTLLPELADLAIDDLRSYLFDRHSRDLLRVQTLDRYDVGSDGDDFRRYLDGEADPDLARKQRWLDELRSITGSGRAWRNVHLVRTPLSDYLRYAFEWGYAYNVAAGQDVRVLDLTESAHLAALAAAKDFYVIDGRHAVRMVYAPGGRYEGAVAISIDGVAGYAALAELAYQLATPFTPWWEAHPEYHRTARVA
jgi:hypothetical protein